jgi:hypothetical protein
LHFWPGCGYVWPSPGFFVLTLTNIAASAARRAVAVVDRRACSEGETSADDAEPTRSSRYVTSMLERRWEE